MPILFYVYVYILIVVTVAYMDDCTISEILGSLLIAWMWPVIIPAQILKKIIR